MAGFDFEAVCRALAEVVARATGQCYWYEPDTPVAPCAWITAALGEFISYEEAFAGGLADVKLRIVLCAGTAGSESEAAIRLAGWLSTGTTSSVPDVVKANHTLGGLTSEITVLTASRAGWMEIPSGTNNRYKVAEIPVDVYLPRG